MTAILPNPPKVCVTCAMQGITRSICLYCMHRYNNVVDTPIRDAEAGARAMYELLRAKNCSWWVPWNQLDRGSENSVHHTWLELAHVCLQEGTKTPTGE